MLLNNGRVNNDIKKESKDTLRQMKTKLLLPQVYGHSKSSPKKEIRSPDLSQEIRKISTQQSNLTLKGTRKRTPNKAQSKRGNRRKLY